MLLKTQGGHFKSFFTSCIALLASLLALYLFSRWAEPQWTEHWESFLHKSTREHSPLGVMGWKATSRVPLYPIFLLLPVLWMLAAFCLQRVLPEKHARTFNRLHTLIILALAAALAYSFVSLLQAP